MHWIKEVQIAKSIHDPVTSRSVAVRCNFSDYDVLSMITSALKKLLTHVHFRQRVSVEEQFAQQIRPILVREANLHTWSMNTFQPPELMEPYKVYKINSIDAYRMMTFKITIQGGTKQWKPQVKHQRKWSWRVSASQNYLNQFSFRLYLLCRTYSKQRTARQRSSNQESKKKKKHMPAQKRQWENAISGKQLDDVRNETHAVSVKIPHLKADARWDKKNNRRVLHWQRRNRLTERYHPKVQAAEERALLEQEAEFRAEILWEESVRIRHVIFGTSRVS